MPTPDSHTTVTIDGNRFNAISTQVGVNTVHDHTGMPMMGAQAWSIAITVDIHDTGNISFQTLSSLYQLATPITRDKIKDIRVEYWADERQQDAICVYSFRGWIASFVTSSGADGNHILDLTLQAELGKDQYVNITMSN